MVARRNLLIIYAILVIFCAAVFSFVTSLATWSLLAILIVAGLGAGVAFMIFRRVDRSTTAIARATREIFAGRSTGIPLSSTDELGRLARSIEDTWDHLFQKTQTLEAEKNQLSTIFESMSEAVLVTDQRGRVVQVNPSFEKVFGIKSDPKNRLLLEVVLHSEIQRGVEDVRKSGQPHQLTVQVSERILLARFTPILSAERLAGVVAVFHEITELKRLEDVRRDFISNVSHELRTPLTSIRAYAETLLDEDSIPPTLRNFIEKIHRNARQLSEMVEELFKLSKLESGEERLRFEEIEFDELMDEIKRDFESRLKEMSADLIILNSASRRAFRASRAYMRRILHNLIDNALRHSGSREIQVELESFDRGVLLSVKDFGAGIPAEDVGRIFERFYRVHKDRSRQTGGSGIGLALVKHMIQVQGGEVWAESELGRGTTISFTLPRDENEKLFHRK